MKKVKYRTKSVIIIENDTITQEPIFKKVEQDVSKIIVI